MPYNAILDFMDYCSCYQIPRNFALWSGIGLMAATTNRKIYVRQGDILHHGQMYIWLVGEQGDKKSTPKSFAEEIYKETFPTIPIGASVQSREQIVEYMSKEGARTFTDENESMVIYHPMMFFVNEVENFLSFNMAGMVSFLVDIYDKKFFDCGTIKRGLEEIPNPVINFLGCCTPKWLCEKMKSSVITGGICRRTILVYEIIDYKTAILIPRPHITPEAAAAKLRVKAHLDKIRNVSAEYKWERSAQEWFDDWYKKLYRNLSDDPIVRGYEKSLDVQLIKMVINWDMANEVPRFLITLELLQNCLKMLEAVKVNLPRLSIAAGRNELAGSQQRMMEIIETAAGKMTAHDWSRLVEADLEPGEFYTLARHLRDTRRVEKVLIGKDEWWFTTKALADAVKNGEIVIIQKDSEGTKIRENGRSTLQT